jgi:hypothetical protein
MTNPYRGLPAFQFWGSAVTKAAPGGLDPVTETKFVVTSTDKVATMGSCFAQHISRHLLKRGLQYFVAETGDPSQSEEQLAGRNYGVFSARYGNVYTVRQAIQLFDRAFDRFRPTESIWERNGGFVDPFRPQIEPEPWSTQEQVEKSRVEHLEAVRRVFTESDVLVFTLGLTETFMSKVDGSVFPVAPGVAGGAFAPELYEFKNFTMDEVKDDLLKFVELVKTVNPGLRIILTVSPVPLIATYEPRHVLISTTLSKAILRVAAHEASRSSNDIEYFPSYEIISGSPIGMQYFADDLREVHQVGVDHVMRIFEKHLIKGENRERDADFVTQSVSRGAPAVVCDEETIMSALEVSRSQTT